MIFNPGNEVYSQRASLFQALRPATQTMLRTIYTNEREFLLYTDPLQNPNRLLESACLAYDASFIIPEAAVQALYNLGIEFNHEETNPRAVLEKHLIRIISDSYLIKKYQQPKIGSA
jgi:hypothetical protein